MWDRKLLTLGAVSGLAYGVLEIAGVVVGGISNPVPVDVFPSTATAQKLADTAMPAGVWLGFGLEVVSTLFLVAFIATITTSVRQTEGTSLLGRIGFGAGMANVAIVFVSFGLMAARDAAGGHGVDAHDMILASYLLWGSYFLSWPSLALFIGTVSVAAVRTAALPTWAGWAGVVVAALGLLGCLDPLNLGQLAQLLPLVWIPVAAAALAVRRTNTAPSPALMIPA